ncbi:MAG: tetratricopeptide repeat protein [Deltaproteobacteria bacterium]|nr:tetratricopeptide repeat protein [Deltaproteobacteria bacterium]
MWVRKLLFVSLGAIALLLFAYGNHYQNGFHLDDESIVVNNSALRSLPASLAAFVDSSASGSDTATQLYRPLAILSLAWDFARAGLSPYRYHLSAMEIFLLLIVVGYFLLRELLKRSFEEPEASVVAFGCICLYAFHAVHAETLNYISARGSLLACLFSTLTLLLYVRSKQARERRLYLLSLTAALLSSKDAAAVPCLLFFYHLLFLSEPGEPADRRLKRATLAAIPSFIVTSLALGLIVALSNSQTPESSYSEYLATQPYAIAHYAAAFFYPIGICAEYGISAGTASSSLASWVSQLLVLCLLALAAISPCTPRGKVVSFGIAWFMFALIPSSLLFPSAQFLDYRRTFFPFLGLALGVGSSLAIFVDWAKARGAWKRRYSTYAITAVLLLLSLHILAIRHRNRIWANEETLWFDVLSKNPSYGRALMNYGLSKMAKNDYDIARLYLEEALRYLPESPQLYADLGTLHGKTSKDPRIAESYFKKAIELDALYAPTYVDYGQWLESRKMNAQAIQAFEYALKIDPTSLRAHYALIDLYFAQRRWARTREAARALLSIHPDDERALRVLKSAEAKAAEGRRR